MAERLWLSFDNHYEVPPAYALAWLTDFRPEDMRHVGGPKMPMIQLTRLEDGQIQREFPLPMGMRMRTRTTVGTNEWVARTQTWDKKGRLVSDGRIVERVTAKGTGTDHHAELHQDDHTTMARLITTLMGPIQRSQIQKIFDVNRRDMEAAFNAGKPPTS